MPSSMVEIYEPGWLTSAQILYGLDYVTRDRYFSTDQVRLARLRHDHNGAFVLPTLCWTHSHSY
jgi:hypothetical protein